MQGGGNSTRERLVEAALDLFIANGFEGTSMREVADKVGVTKPALYHYFVSKEDLLRAVVQPVVSDINGLLERAEATGSADRDFLASYFDVVMRHKEVTVWLSGDSSARSRAAELTGGWHQQTRLMDRLRGEDRSFERRVRVACALGALQVGIMTFAATGGLERAQDEILTSAASLLKGES